MAIQPTASIWHNGNLIPWENATIHVMSHVVHYGSSVFEGIRCYASHRARPFSGCRSTCSASWTRRRSIAWSFPTLSIELCAAVVEVD